MKTLNWSHQTNISENSLETSTHKRRTFLNFGLFWGYMIVIRGEGAGGRGHWDSLGTMYRDAAGIA